MFPTLRREVERFENEMVHFTQALVRTPSLCLHETDVAGLVEKKLHELEFDLVFTDEIGNIVGVVLGGDPRFTVVLNSHMDTICPDPVDAWSFSPFGGDIVAGRITGVGAADCKSGIATQIFAAHALAHSMLPRRGNIVVAATVAEENGCSVGARHLFQHTLPGIGMIPRFAVLGEPTGLRVGYGHDGWARFDIDIMGVDEHEVRKVAQQVFDHFSIFCDAPDSSTATSMMAAEPPELTAGTECFTDLIRIVRRLLAGETIDDIVDRLNEEIFNNLHMDRSVVVEAHLHEELQRPYSGGRVHVRVMTQPWFPNLRHPLVDRVREALVTAGFEWAPKPWVLDRLGMGTAGSFITNEIGIPTICFGPGEEEQAHACDESVSISKLVEAAFGAAAITYGLIGSPMKGLH